MMLFSIGFYVLALFVILFQSKVYLHEPNADYLGKTNSHSIRAICSWGVVMCHVSNTVDCGIYFLPLQAMGFLMVAMFFFFSGYGLMYSLNHKNNYMQTFYKKRSVEFLIPYMISLLTYVLYYAIFWGEMDFSRLLTQFIDGNPVVRYSWFIFVLLQLYIIFWFSFGLIRNRKISYPVFYGLCLAMAGNIFMPYWSPAIIAFIMGSFFAHKKKKVDKLAMKYSGILLSLSFVAFAVLTFFYIRRGDADTIVFKFFLSFAFVMLIVSALTRIQLDNAILRYLGKISYEVYLYHGLITIILNQIPTVFQNPMLYIVLVIPLTFVTATVMYHLRILLFNARRFIF